MHFAICCKDHASIDKYKGMLFYALRYAGLLMICVSVHDYVQVIICPDTRSYFSDIKIYVCLVYMYQIHK